ncbi:MAG: ROK family protein [Solirubrobacterales bacterium]|nr:ROK family protein [Solirubrobacterales bacterium]
MRDLLAEKVDLPVSIDNDANVAMLAEALFGAARGVRHALLLTLGTGIGGGVWIDGKLFRGSGGAGAELGHTVVEIDGPCRTCRAGAVASKCSPRVTRSAGRARRPRSGSLNQSSAGWPLPASRSPAAR